MPGLDRARRFDQRHAARSDRRRETFRATSEALQQIGGNQSLRAVCSERLAWAEGSAPTAESNRAGISALGGCAASFDPRAQSSRVRCSCSGRRVSFAVLSKGDLPAIPRRSATVSFSTARTDQCRGAYPPQGERSHTVPTLLQHAQNGYPQFGDSTRVQHHSAARRTGRGGTVEQRDSNGGRSPA